MTLLSYFCQHHTVLPYKNKKLSCRRETEWRFVSLNILLKSLKVSQAHSKWHSWVGRVQVPIHWNYVCISYRLWDTFSFKEWRDLETGSRGRSRSLKMAPFDRAYTTFYWSAIVNIALSRTIFELRRWKIVTLKSGLAVTQDHSNWYHSKAWVQFPIRLP